MPADAKLDGFVVEPPREAAHGDLATNAAMVLAKPAGKNPKELAATIAERIRLAADVEKVEVAGPGFINITLKAEFWPDVLRAVLAAAKTMAEAISVRASPSMWSLSPQTRPAPCMWAIHAARCLAMRLPICSP